MKIWIIDGDDGLGHALANNFVSANHQVVMHSRTSWQKDLQTGVELIESALPVDNFSQWFEQRGAPDCVIFNLSAKDELELLRDDGDVEMLVQQLSNDLPNFLREIQSISMLLARAGQGKIWVLVQEDSMGYYVPTPVASVASRARISAVKSLAKEVARLGVKINAVSVQAYREQLESAVWGAAREDLKAYALKFKPIDANAIADTLRCLTETVNLPIVGMVLPLAVGAPDFNI